MPEAWRKRFQVRDFRAAAIAPPPGILHIWEWYQEIALDRDQGFTGPAPIKRLDIIAWSALSGYAPSPTEVRLILLTDSAWRAEIARLQKLKKPKAQ